MPDFKNLIFIGKLSKTTGLKGSLKMLSLTDFPERFKVRNKVFLVDDEKKQLLTNKHNNCENFEIEEFSSHNNVYKIKFKSFDTIDDVTELVNKFVSINDGEKVNLDKNGFYYHEIIDALVFAENKYIGNISKVENYGGDDLLLVKTESEKELFIPVREEFIIKIDIDEKRVDVKNIEGLIDI